MCIFCSSFIVRRRLDLTGENQFAIAAGVESMTQNYFPHRGIPTRIYQAFKNEASSEDQNVLMPMGITSETVAKSMVLQEKTKIGFLFNLT